MHDKDNAEEDKRPKEVDNQGARKELLDQLESTVNYFHKLPQHEKFSFATNADLYHLMQLVLSILKTKTR
jgi:hypothetical protein